MKTRLQRAYEKAERAYYEAYGAYALAQDVARNAEARMFSRRYDRDQARKAWEAESERPQH